MGTAGFQGRPRAGPGRKPKQDLSLATWAEVNFPGAGPAERKARHRSAVRLPADPDDRKTFLSPSLHSRPGQGT